MEASWSDRGTVTLANKLISQKDSAWITVLIKRSADPRLETHCGKNEDNRGLRGMSEGLPALQVSDDSRAFCPCHGVFCPLPINCPVGSLLTQVSQRWLANVSLLPLATFLFSSARKLVGPAGEYETKHKLGDHCGSQTRSGGTLLWIRLTKYKLWRWGNVHEK